MKTLNFTLIPSLFLVMLGLWATFCLFATLYIITPYTEVFFGYRVTSINELVYKILQQHYEEPFIVLAISLAAILVSLGLVGAMLSLSMWFFDINRDAISGAFYWALGALLKHKKLVFTYFLIICTFILCDFAQMVDYLIIFLGLLSFIIIPFSVLQVWVFNDKQNSRLFRSLSWTGFFPIILFVLFSLIVLAIEVLGEVFSIEENIYLFVLFNLVLFFSVEIFSIIQTWAFLTRSNLGQTVKIIPKLLSREIFGGWVILGIYWSILFGFLFLPIFGMSVIDTMFYPAISYWNETNSTEIGRPITLIHQFFKNGNDAILLMLIPIQICTLLVAGKYLINVGVIEQKK